MGNFDRLCLGVVLLSWSAAAAAEGTPAAPQWSAPAPTSAPAAPSASSPASPAALPAPATTPSAAPPAPAAPPNALPAPAPASPSGAPPAAYAQPYQYPYPAYPPPYGYYPPPPRPLYPDDSAVRSTPFIDALVTSVSWENRFSQFLVVGAQAGVYVAGRLRLTVNAMIPTDKLNDEYYGDGAGNYEYASGRSKDASFLYGASAGIVAARTSNFALSPGIAFARSDVSDYGTMLALSMPLEWVLPSGMRVGFVPNLGRVFGGSFVRCADTFCSQSFRVDRPAGTALLLQFQLGFGFNHPAPSAPDAR